MKHLKACVLSMLLLAAIWPAVGLAATGGAELLTADVRVYSTSAMIDSAIIAYAEEIILPEKAGEKLYTFADPSMDEAPRTISAVYTNSEPALREDETSVPGRYVILQLTPAEPPAGQTEPWRAESRAGAATLWTGSASQHRMDGGRAGPYRRLPTTDRLGRELCPPDH